jgi:hypothetical protein
MVPKMKYPSQNSPTNTSQHSAKYLSQNKKKLLELLPKTLGDMLPEIPPQTLANSAWSRD